MLNIIKLNDRTRIEFHSKTSRDYIVGLNKINVFIGLNNSGKSRFIRYLFSNINTLPYIDLNQKYAHKHFISSLEISINDTLRHIKDTTIKKEILLSLFDITNKSNHSNNLIFNELFKLPRIIRELYEHFKELSPHSQIIKSIGLLQQKTNNMLLTVWSKRGSSSVSDSDQNKLYIPLLRGLRPIQFKEHQFLNTDSYLKRTQYDYFPSTKHTHNNIYTGLSMYEDIKRLLLGTEEERKTIADFENFLTEEIFNEKVTLIPKYNDDVLHIKLGASNQHKIYNLGDGLQTIISILFPIFLRRNQETFIFIEEPEAHLHPEWQLKLINTLKKFKKHQFFVSTHSSSFINSLDTSIYLVKKEDNRSTIHYANLESDKVNILQELGYKPSDLFLTNYLLWVEGPSDKIYLEYWIHKVSPELKEGKHYSIMFYGGDNHKQLLYEEGDLGLSFIRTLNQNFGIILDSDRKKETDEDSEYKKKIKELFESNDSYCWITKFREIENYIPFNIFEQAVKNVHQKSDIEIPTGNYDDRNTIIDNKNNNSYKSSIKIPEYIFQQIQKNKDGTTKNIDAETLRKGIEDAIQKTKKDTFNTSKIRVAKETIKLKPDIEEEELKLELVKLVKKIKIANNIKEQTL